MFFNGEAIQMFHPKSAHTDGDSIVFFRRSDVVLTGDIFSTTTYPIIDIQNGGSINGVIDALNFILDLTIPAEKQEGGTMVIPGHGRLCDEADVVEYRDMIPRDNRAVLVHAGTLVDHVGQPVIFPGHLVFSRELNTHGLADRLRKKRGVIRNRVSSIDPIAAGTHFENHVHAFLWNGQQQGERASQRINSLRR